MKTKKSIIKSILSDLSVADYITVGFYDIEQGATAVSIGNDTRKYFFREE